MRNLEINFITRVTLVNHIAVAVVKEVIPGGLMDGLEEGVGVDHGGDVLAHFVDASVVKEAAHIGPGHGIMDGFNVNLYKNH